MPFEYNINGLEELRRAVKRNPGKILDEVNKFLTRGGAVYKSTILNNPWRMGMAGGGAPRATGNLAATHVTEQTTWEWRMYPTAPYAEYVHGIEGWSRKRKYQLRPWLDYAEQANEGKIQTLEKELLDNIVDDLAQ